MHDFPLITLLAAAFFAAWIFGLITQRIGLSPIVGYLLAGIAIGPYTPGFVGDQALATELAELGVILLMFGVGLHFHLRDLMAVRRIALPGAIGQSLVATIAGTVIFGLMGWPVTSGLVVGTAMAVASTVVLMRVLMDANQLNTPQGHAAVGWLIVEDLITVVVLVLIPALAGTEGVKVVQDAAHAAGEAAAHGAPAGRGWLLSLSIAIGKLAVLVAIVLVGGAKVVPWILVQVAKLRSRELFTLTVLVLSIAVATGSSIFFGASVALGAFLAGMVVAQSPVSHQAGTDVLPLRDAFAVLFFVSVGMLFDPRFIVEHPGLLMAGLAIVLVAKPLAALVIVVALGYPAKTALTVAVGLAQIGEFSFIVGELARKHGLVNEDAVHLLVGCAIVSITINPLLFRSLGPIEAWMRARPRLWRMVNGRSERRAQAGNERAVGHVAEATGPLAIVVGFGPVGQQVDRLLRKAGLSTVIIDLNMDAVAAINAVAPDPEDRSTRVAIFGDATTPEILKQAGVTRASHLIISTPHAAEHSGPIGMAKDLNPSIKLLVRTRYLREEEQARQFGADAAVVDEVESGVALSELVLAETGVSGAAAKRETDRVRVELASAQRVTHA